MRNSEQKPESAGEAGDNPEPLLGYWCAQLAERMEKRNKELEAEVARLRGVLEQIGIVRAMRMDTCRMCRWCENEADTPEEIQHAADCPTNIARAALAKQEKNNAKP